MTFGIGSLVMKGLPAEYSRAVERRLAGEIQRRFAAGAGMSGWESRDISRDRVSIRLPKDWHQMNPDAFVEMLAESICKEVRFE